MQRTNSSVDQTKNEILLLLCRDLEVDISAVEQARKQNAGKDKIEVLENRVAIVLSKLGSHLRRYPTIARQCSILPKKEPDVDTRGRNGVTASPVPNSICKAKDDDLQIEMECVRRKRKNPDTNGGELQIEIECVPIGKKSSNSARKPADELQVEMECIRRTVKESGDDDVQVEIECIRLQNGDDAPSRCGTAECIPDIILKHVMNVLSNMRRKIMSWNPEGKVIPNAVPVRHNENQQIVVATQSPKLDDDLEVVEIRVNQKTQTIPLPRTPLKNTTSTAPPCTDTTHSPMATGMTASPAGRSPVAAPSFMPVEIHSPSNVTTGLTPLASTVPAHISTPDAARVCVPPSTESRQPQKNATSFTSVQMQSPSNVTAGLTPLASTVPTYISTPDGARVCVPPSTESREPQKNATSFTPVQMQPPSNVTTGLTPLASTVPTHISTPGAARVCAPPPAAGPQPQKNDIEAIQRDKGMTPGKRDQKGPATCPYCDKLFCSFYSMKRHSLKIHKQAVTSVSINPGLQAVPNNAKDNHSISSDTSSLSCADSIYSLKSDTEPSTWNAESGLTFSSFLAKSPERNSQQTNTYDPDVIYELSSSNDGNDAHPSIVVESGCGTSLVTADKIPDDVGSSSTDIGLPNLKSLLASKEKVSCNNKPFVKPNESKRISGPIGFSPDVVYELSSSSSEDDEAGSLNSNKVHGTSCATTATKVSDAVPCPVPTYNMPDAVPCPVPTYNTPDAVQCTKAPNICDKNIFPATIEQIYDVCPTDVEGVFDLRPVITNGFCNTNSHNIINMNNMHPTGTTGDSTVSTNDGGIYSVCPVSHLNIPVASPLPGENLNPKINSPKDNASQIDKLSPMIKTSRLQKHKFPSLLTVPGDNSGISQTLDVTLTGDKFLNPMWRVNPCNDQVLEDNVCRDRIAR